MVVHDTSRVCPAFAYWLCRVVIVCSLIGPRFLLSVSCGCICVFLCRSCLCLVCRGRFRCSCYCLVCVRAVFVPGVISAWFVCVSYCMPCGLLMCVLSAPFGCALPLVCVVYFPVLILDFNLVGQFV